MTALPDALASWKPIDYSGSGDLLDSSGNGHDAVLQGSPTFTAGTYFDMDGANDFFSVPDDPALDFGASDDFSIVFVGSSSSEPAQSEWGLAKKAGKGTDLGYGIHLWFNGSAQFNIGDGTNDGRSAFPGADILPFDTIFAVAGIRDTGADELSWAFDGTERDAATDITTGTIANNINVFLCGDQNAPASDCFTGRFYGAAIFAAVLTAAEVESIKDEILTAASTGVAVVTDHLHLPGTNGQGAELDYVTEQDTWEAHIQVAFADWSSGDEMLFSQWDDAGGQNHFTLRKNNDGTIQLRYIDDGASNHFINSTVAPSLAVDGEPLWLRITFEIDRGDSNFEVVFYERVNVTDAWTQIGTAVFGTTFTQNTTDEEWRVGGIRPEFNFEPSEAGFYALTVWSDLTETTKIIDVDFTALTVADLAAASFTDGEGNTVTLVGDAWTYARPYTIHDILRETEALYMAGDGNKFFSPKWADRSGHNHHARNGSTDGADANDALGKAFDGLQYVHFPTSGAGNWIVDATPPASADVAVEEVATMAAWVRISALTNTNGTAFGTRANGDGIAVSFVGNTAKTARLTVGDGTTQLLSQAGPALTIDEWHHIAITVDHTSAVDIAKLYVDGVQRGSDLDISAVTGTMNATHLSIGGTSDAGNHEPGDIAYVEFYKDIATDQEILDAHNGGVGTGIVGLSDVVSVVDFGDTSMVAKPYTGFTDPQGNVYVINRASTGLVTTIIDQDQWLHSTDDYHEVPDAPGLNFADGESLTLMLVSRSHNVTTGMSVDKSDGFSSTDKGYRLDINAATDFPRAEVSDGTIQPGDNHIVAAVDGELYSSAMVWKGTANELEVFLDAVGSGSPGTGNPGSLSNALTFDIGRIGTNYMEGSVMAVALWRRALTNAEILDAHRLLTGQGLVKDNYLHLPGVTDNKLTTPDSPALDEAGILDVRCRWILPDWSPADVTVMMAKWASGGWLFYLNTGDILLSISLSGGDEFPSVTQTAHTDGDIGWLRATRDPSTGDVKFFEADGDLDDPQESDYTQIDTTVSTAAGEIVGNSAGVEVGFYEGGGPITGNLYRAQVINDGVLELDIDATGITAADLEAGTFIENSVNAAVVTLNGDEWAYPRPYDRDDLLATAELLLQAGDGNKFFSPKWADRSRRNHHAQNGSAAGADANDALGKRNDGKQYVRLPGTSDNILTSPTSTDLDLTDDAEWRFDVALDDYTPTSDKRIFSRDAGGSDRGWNTAILTDGKLLLFAEDGSGGFGDTFISSVAPSLTDGRRYQFQVTLDASGITTVKWFFREATVDLASDVGWVQIGGNITGGGAQTWKAITAEVQIGADGGGNQRAVGDYYRAMLYDGIGGTIVFDAVLEDADQPYATFTERSSNAATVTVERSSTGLRSTLIDRDQWLYATDDYHLVADHPALDFGPTDDWTVIAVGRQDDSGGNGFIFGKTDSAAANGWFIKDEITVMNVQARGVTNETDEVALTVDQTLFSLTGRFNDADNELEAFLDGIGSGSPTAGAVTEPSGDVLSIGAWEPGSASFLDGQIMAVALWRRALTDAEVLEAHDLLIGLPITLRVPPRFRRPVYYPRRKREQVFT